MLQFEEYKVKLNNLKPEIEGLTPRSASSRRSAR